MQSKYDVIVVGMGPSSIFCAYELIQLKKYKHVLLIDQGKRVEDRYCPIEKTKKCVHCKPMCNITNGFSGAGAFSDGKLSLYDSKDDDIHVGGILHKYIGVPKTKELIDYTDKIYLYINKPFKEIKKEVVDVDQVYMYEVLNFINNKYSLEIEEYIYEYVILLADKYKDFRSENTNNINLSAKINDNYSYLIDIHENMLRFCIKVE